MTTNATYLDEFMDSIITVPNNINRLLRLIRKLDKKTQQVQISLNSQQNKFLSQLKQLKDKKPTQLPPPLKLQYQNILKKQRQVYGYSREKKQIGDQLYHEVVQYQQALSNELKNKYKEKPDEQILKRKKMKIDATKLNPPSKKEDFYYDVKQYQYCYCQKNSYGEMVACENPYCQRQWFHTSCIEQKILPDKWYCNQCAKQRDKTRNTISRSFFVNKEA